MDTRTFDYVVVGGGSSGCVVAGLLADDPSVQVALLELGDTAESHPETLSADGYKDAFANDALVLERFSTAQQHCGRQNLFLGSGRGLGGSGSINGMVYTRGAREDYDSWPRGWRFDDLVPHFSNVEQRLRVRPRAATEFTETFVKGAVEAGFRRASDLNSGDLSGVFGYETMNYEGDRRRSSYVAFVKDRQLPNLTVLSGACTRRVLFEGKRAVGVEVEREGKVEVLRARAEVVLCAGALETPKLLMLSGVGPAAELARWDIPLVHDARDVGQNLHDHPNVTMFFLGREPVDSHYPQLYGFHRANPESDLPAGQSDTCYVMYPARSSFREAAMRMLPTKLPLSLYGASSKRMVRGAVSLATGLTSVQKLIARMWGCVVILGKPKSRGQLTLSSQDARAQASIDPAYFAHPEDMETMIRGVRLGRQIAQSRALEAWGNRPLLPPRRELTDAQIRAFIEGNAMTTFHYAGTCRMGEDESAVVDTSLRVRGVTGLRVADASITPWTPVSAMNAPSMMIGHRAAELLLKDRKVQSLQTEQELGPWPA